MEKESKPNPSGASCYQSCCSLKTPPPISSLHFLSFFLPQILQGFGVYLLRTLPLLASFNTDGAMMTTMTAWIRFCRAHSHTW